MIHDNQRMKFKKWHIVSCLGLEMLIVRFND